MNASLPKIVLLGRPNVGKSTLFNRLIRSNRAITHDQPGITRDRLEGVVRKHKQPLFTIVDTGGLNLTTSSLVDTGPKGIRGFEQAIFDQTQQALAHAQAIVLVVDAKAGLSAQDKELADLARRFNLPIICAVNKVDGLELTDNLCADFHALGLPLLAISAAHGLNIPNLISQISDLVKFEIDLQPNEESLGETKAPLRLALLGRPNAGKSSLVNAWVEEDRMIISEQAGTTRDSVDVYAAINGQEYVFVDTAGVRRKTKITDSVERFSVNSALKTTSKADVTLLVLDAKVGLENQDKRLIDLLATRKTPFLILANKIDLLSDQAINNLRKELDTALAFCSYVPVLMVSAKSHKGLKKVLSLAAEVKRECSIRVPTGQLNRAMATVLQAHQPPMVKNARPRFFYLTQAENEPPTFVFFVSDATRVPKSYLIYLERSLRKLFAIKYAPIRMHLRSSHSKDK